MTLRNKSGGMEYRPIRPITSDQSPDQTRTHSNTENSVLAEMSAEFKANNG